MKFRIALLMGMIFSSGAFAAVPNPWNESTLFASCRRAGDWVTVSIHQERYQYKAFVFDNYDRTDELNCQQVGERHFTCTGNWLVTQEPARVDFKFKLPNHPSQPFPIVAKVRRSSLWKYKDLLLSCKYKGDESAFE